MTRRTPTRLNNPPKLTVRAVRLVALPVHHIVVDTPSGFTLQLRPTAFILARLMIATIHALCAAYYDMAGYIFLKLPSSNSTRLLDFWSVTLPFKFFPTFRRIYLTFAIAHAVFAILDTMGASWKGLQVPPALIKQSSRNNRLTSFVMRMLLWLHTQPFPSKGILGIENPHFDGMYLLRKIVETGLQTHQAYQISRLLPRKNLLQFYISVLVLSCWITPLLHRFIINKPLQRLLCRMVDVALDFFACVGVPVVLAVSYVGDIDRTTLDIHKALYQNTTWLIHAMNEAPLILFGSWTDAFGRLLFSMGLISSLRVLRRLLVYRNRRIQLVPLNPHHASRTRTRHPPKSQVARAIHAGFVVYGAVILILHVDAHSRTSLPPSCKLGVHPWFAHKPACAIIEINCCTNRSAEGNALELRRVFETIDEGSVTQIVVRHCRQVGIPSTLALFSYLTALTIYNSSIVTWNDSAALTQTSHPRVRIAHSLRTQFANGTLPAGLVSFDYPDKLLDMVFSVTNINRLPPDLYLKWPSGVVIALEQSELSDYPIVLTKLRPVWLCLDGNRIEKVPAEAFSSDKTQRLQLNGNPIETLPEAVDGSAVELSTITLAMTNLQELPQWMDRSFFARADRVVILSGTPACENPKSQWMNRVSCSEADKHIGAFSMDVEIRADETW